MGYERFLEFIKEAKALGAVEVSISDAGATVKFATAGVESSQSAAIINDLLKDKKEENDEDLFYWSSNG